MTQAEQPADSLDNQGSWTEEPDSEFYVVGIGASAGGLEALEQFFDNMPSDSGMAFIVVQHLSPDFKSLMDELLARHTEMAIHRVENGMPITPNGIYLIPPKKNMVLSDGKLLLTEQDPSGGLNLPIDIFFRSLAQDVGKRSIAIVLSGTGSDGSRGLQDVHEGGGLIVVQTAESAGFDGMPRNAIGTGLADVITSAQSMPESILQYVESPEAFRSRREEPQEPVLPGGELAAIFALFRKRYGIDFTLYREATIQRRIERRMQLIRVRRLLDYVEILRGDTAELEHLYRDLLVEVTQFFRDPQAFTRLREDVIPQLLDRVEDPRREIRVWVAGCATGEEAYSLAMLFDDCAAERGLSPIIKVFATDVHRASLEIASTGVYSGDAIANLPEHLQAKYFTPANGLFHVNQELRQMVIFAPHNVASDPPFTRIDLISCRNVLIYIRPEVQERILSLFHFGLNVGGCLMLGSSETVGDLAREFETVDQHWRIFTKLRDVRLHKVGSLPLAPAISGVVRPKPPLNLGIIGGEQSVDTAAFENVIERYVPPSFVVNRHYELVHTFGDANKILVQPKGRPTLDVLRMVDGDLRMALSASLHRAARENERVILQGIKVQVEGRDTVMQVSVEPCSKKTLDLFLVCLEELKDRSSAIEEPDAEQFSVNDHATQRIVDLERELEFKKETLQTTVEELESSNEELQSTNEELVASNEELQSTNEELHSVNEELYTVNAEHQRKIEELTTLTADMDNLIRATDIGTLFLDRELRIRRFTPSISSAFNVMEQDIGRPIEQFAYRFESPGWIDRAKEVLATGEPVEMQLRLPGASDTFLKRIRPYRGLDGQISGIVITFTEITAIVQSKERERERREHLEQVTTDLQEFAYAVSHDLHGPLRQIKSAAEHLAVDFGGDVDDAQRSSLTAIDKRVGRMQRLLDCLLDYSRVKTQGGPLELVDVGSMVGELVREFKRDSEREIQFHLSELSNVVADGQQLKMCVWHLIDNAIKYCVCDSPEIRIQTTIAHGRWTLKLDDNGVGIRPQHVREVFGIFKRLGFVEEVDGLGFGLALCKRIIERHNGKIWVESDLASGSAFHIELPIDVVS